MVGKLLASEAFKVRSKVWVLTIGVLEVNPELDSVRAQRGRARSKLLSQCFIMFIVTCPNFAEALSFLKGTMKG